MSRKLEKSILSRDEISLLLNSEASKDKNICGNLYDILLKINNLSSQKLKAISLFDLEKYGIDSKAISVLTYNKDKFFSIILHEWYAEQKIDEDPNKKYRCGLCNTPNKYIFYIRNTKNDILLNVGSSCIKKFPGIEGYTEATKRFKDVIKKQQELSRTYQFKEKIPEVENIISFAKSYFDTLPILLPEKLYISLRDISDRMRSIYSRYVYDGRTPYKTTMTSFELFQLQIQNFENLKLEADKFISENINKSNMCKRREIDWLLKNDNENIVLSIAKNNGQYTTHTLSNIYSNEFIKDNFELFVSNNCSNVFKIKGVNQKTNKIIFAFNKLGYTPPLMFFISYHDFMASIGSQCVINNKQYGNTEIIESAALFPLKDNLESIIRYTHNMTYESYYEFLFSSDKNIFIIRRMLDGAIAIIDPANFMKIYEKVILKSDEEIKMKLQAIIKRYKLWISVSEQYKLGYVDIIKQIKEEKEDEYTYIKKHSFNAKNYIEVPFYNLSNGTIGSNVDFISIPKKDIMLPKSKYFLIDFATTISTYEMNPKIKPGDTVFIHKTSKVEDGDTVLFMLNKKIHIGIYNIANDDDPERFVLNNKSQKEILNSKKVFIIGKVMCYIKNKSS